MVHRVLTKTDTSVLGFFRVAQVGRWINNSAITCESRSNAASKAESRGKNPPCDGSEDIMAERFDGHHLPPWAARVQGMLKSKSTGAALKKLDVGFKGRATMIWMQSFKHNLSKLSEVAGREDEIVKEIEEATERLMDWHSALSGIDDTQDWHLKSACTNASALRVLRSNGVATKDAVALLAGVNGGHAKALRARIKAFSFFWAKNLFRKDLFWEDAQQLVALGQGMGKGFKPHLLVPETPDTGIELQFQQCVYRTVFAEANVPELEEATCCSLESQDFEDAERFGHQFKLTKCRNLEGSCCMALGRNLEGFPLDPDSADVDEVPLFKD